MGNPTQLLCEITPLVILKMCKAACEIETALVLLLEK